MGRGSCRLSKSTRGPSCSPSPSRYCSIWKSPCPSGSFFFGRQTLSSSCFQLPSAAVQGQRTSRSLPGRQAGGLPPLISASTLGAARIAHRRGQIDLPLLRQLLQGEINPASGDEAGTPAARQPQPLLSCGAGAATTAARRGSGSARSTRPPSWSSASERGPRGRGRAGADELESALAARSPEPRAAWCEAQGVCGRRMGRQPPRPPQRR
jgi:hypothetical protein